MPADLRQPPPAGALRWIERSIGVGAQVLGSSRLTGGLTAAIDRVRVRGRGGDVSEVVLRRWPDGNEWWIGSVEEEAAGLEALAAHRLPTPRPIAIDPTGAQVGARAILTSALDGQPLLTPTDFDAWVGQLAGVLARVHAVGPVLTAERRVWFDETADRSWLDDAGLAVEAVAAATSATGAGSPGQRTLVHGDYQYFNVLWRQERLSGVVDWPGVGSGQRGLDVGHCRVNLAVLYSAELAEQFRQRYEAAAGVRVDPRVDLASLLSFGPGWGTFIPRQVDGRMPVDGAGMSARMTTLVRSALRRAEAWPGG